ncbi:DMT family transporter [Hyunsoonleella flava]|uniref:DMT family transporter n=1 Tax=Hyunsoonleella flava TaxID=2527939 RepID=A0A4Q9FFN4_9FLAO|nr:DMT family transporter [Hyunsoonleella flava]TBM99757.1 DMT family transporter [Hyunsoonleella flava]
MNSKKNFWLGIGTGVLGVVLFSSKAVMVKLAYKFDVDAISVLLLRMSFSFPIYIIIAYLYRHQNTSIHTSSKDYLWLIFFGFVGYYLASYFDFIGLTYIKASLERIILFLYPTIVLLLNRFFLKQNITTPQIIAITLTYLGIVIAFWDEVNISGEGTLLGGSFILLSAIAYASYLVGSGWLIPKFGIMKFTSYAMVVSCICVFIHYALVNKTDILNLPWEVYFLGFLIAVFATVVPSFLVSTSIKMISSSNFAVVAGVGPISTIILAVIFLEERLTILQLFGALIVVLGVLFISLHKSSKT